MCSVVAVVDPVPRAVREPRQRERLERIDDLRDGHASLCGIVRRVRHAVAMRVQPEIEPVQMHRVVRLREVHHAPVLVLKGLPHHFDQPRHPPQSSYALRQ